MKLTKLVPLIAITLCFSLSKAWKEKENLGRFLQLLNLNHLDLITSDSFLYYTDNILDEEFDTIIQIFQNQSKFFSGKQSCNSSSLYILPMESLELDHASEDNCTSTPGKFIKNQCVTYFAFTDAYPIDNVFKKVECTLDHQPYIFVLVETKDTNYELLELQIPSKRMLVIATWNTIDDIR